jgi:ketosteroid isomerase-like protein
VDGDVAFCHFLYRVSGTTANGKIGMWVRATVCLRRIDGRWLITHEHDSVPFEPETGKAALDLQP